MRKSLVNDLHYSDSNRTLGLNLLDILLFTDHCFSSEPSEYLTLTLDFVVPLLESIKL